MIEVNTHYMNLEVQGRWYESDTAKALKALVRYGTIHLHCEEDDLLDLMLSAWKCLVPINVDLTERPHPLFASSQNSLNHTIPVYEISLKTPRSVFRLGDHGSIPRNM